MNAAISLDDARRHARETVERSRTSFGPGMRILSKPRREGMYAVYAFCREVDDIADGDDAPDDKLAALGAWRKEVAAIFAGAPQTKTGAALVGPVRDFDIPRDEFLLVIEGMEMDARGPIVAPSMDALRAYTRRAAGAVGLLSMPVFGAPKGETSDRFAIALGDALQLTNILRDVEQDAGEGRLYLPRELLAKHGCPLDPATISAADGLPAVREEIAELARERFAEARAALKFLEWRVLKPALLMMGVYERYLDKMIARGFANGQPRIALSKAEKSAIALKWFFAPDLDGRG